MATITFDTHKFILRLREAGIPEEQAEAIAAAFSNTYIESEVATKTVIRELEYRLIIKLGAMIVAAATVVATLVKIL